MDEFIDAYSDDQVFLQLLELLVENDATERLTPESIKYSSYCRLWSVMTIGSMEMIIKKWHKGDRLGRDIASYFDGGQKNEDRINRLITAFSTRNITITNDILADFLAIKYIRNAYIHGDWQYDSNRKYVISRKFPDNLMKFTKENFDRMKLIHDEVMKALAFAKSYNEIHKSKGSVH